MALVQTPDRFDPYFMEQSLLNYAHRRDGSMPWQPLAPHWNVNWPNARDATLGVKSFHDKFWQDDNPHLDAALKQLWQEQNTAAEAFYRARDAKAS
jgi:alpha-N-acetylglucosamine transferase